MYLNSDILIYRKGCKAMSLMVLEDTDLMTVPKSIMFKDSFPQFSFSVDT